MNDTAGSGDLSKTSASDNTDGKNYSLTFLCDLPWFIIEIGLHKTGGH